MPAAAQTTRGRDPTASGREPTATGEALYKLDGFIVLFSRRVRWDCGRFEGRKHGVSNRTTTDTGVGGAAFARQDVAGARTQPVVIQHALDHDPGLPGGFNAHVKDVPRSPARSGARTGTPRDHGVTAQPIPPDGAFALCSRAF